MRDFTGDEERRRKEKKNTPVEKLDIFGKVFNKRLQERRGGHTK